MTERIQCLSVARLTPGMHLARALQRPDGAVLMAEGTELTEALLDHLHQRGVEHVFVTTLETRDPQTVADDLAAAEERVKYIFRLDPSIIVDDPGFGEARESLRDAVLAYRRSGGGA